MSKRSFTLRGMAIGLVMLMFACSEDLENKMGPPDVTQDVAVDVDMDGDVVRFSDQLVANQYIVVFKKEKTGYAGARFSGPKQASEHVKKQALSIVRSVAPAFSEDQFLAVYHSINGAAIKLSDDKVEALRNDERVAYIEQDRIITLARPGSGGGDGSTVEEVPPGVQRVTGQKEGIEYSGSNKAWVIDTGVDLTHPDLDPVPDDPNMAEPTGGSATFVDFGKDAKTADDYNGHGTHVAGTIAAEKDDDPNFGGVVGVAAGAKLVAVKVLDQRGSGYLSDVIEGVQYVGNYGQAGDVANMSLGGGFYKALNDAVIEASTGNYNTRKVSGIYIYFTLAAGNDSKHAKDYSPASANGTYIFTISAMDVRNNYTDTDLNNDDIWASFSNYGNPPVDFCAPGVGVKSTYKDGTYKTLSGTSMAAPHAAGVLLLVNPADSNGDGIIDAVEVGSDGVVKNDPDGNSDPIIYCTNCSTTSTSTAGE